MTDLDDTLVPAVAEMLQDFGVSATYVQRETTPSSTGTPAVIDTPYAITVTPPLTYSRRMVEADITLQGMLHMYIAGQNLAFTPKQGDEVRIDGQPIRRVVEFRPLYSGVSIAAYDLKLRD